ncbi:cobalamin biosynthesis protein CobD [Cyanobium sp. HWJ4-Hawea]|uniref:adenosylcobinamide-phosphate synthase CbiB n=1 Tax=Cyanobium sp. HWJ4-Hawea TaxID=2823713 RepID=UPI0020CBF35B|nr:adenosylcobinamide-phosphate synthase CbiB [Cyanobium sp. HWJ4-Hawea]MCP9807921.1 cobalamin biosynthesis protein CobD [Cyanobium sp. HWJ4-Hawea]
MVGACGLDRLVGDPRWCLHPVVVMGWWIGTLRGLVEAIAGSRPWALRLGGCLITALLVATAGLAGLWIERFALGQPALGGPVLLVGLASALAGRSLDQAVHGVLNALPNLGLARERLAGIVGRDTADLGEAEILRALAETASENAVDGLFSPLFWMLLGAGLWSLNPSWPGPLALAWGFKAASTLDSMLGYRHGTLRWLGTAGARLDDLMVWLPCRLVAFSLPLALGRGFGNCFASLNLALADGASDPSPNAGVSQAAYAHGLGVQLGGVNSYRGATVLKPLLAPANAPANRATIAKILRINGRLQLIWLALAGLGAFMTKILR